MHEDKLDFEGTTIPQQNGSAKAQESTVDTKLSAQDDTTSLSGEKSNDITSKDGNTTETTSNNQEGNVEPTSLTGELAEGDSIEFDGVNYIVDANGNLVDDNGVIFKEAKDVAAWLKSVDVDDATATDDGLNLTAIQDALGVTVTDSDGKVIEFTNDAAGVKAYVNSVIDLKSNELQTAAVNKLYADNPLLKQFVDYVQLNGTPRGFGEIPDRSGIQINKDNQMQQEAIIRMAAQEFGNKSLNENYIK